MTPEYFRHDENGAEVWRCEEHKPNRILPEIYTASGTFLWKMDGDGPNPRFLQKNCQTPVFSGYTFSFRPCRRCILCLKRRRWLWYLRAMIEIRTWPRSWFVTLTFSSIPEDPYSEVQKFLKRLRKDYRGQFKYLCAQEHGSKGGRIHYHLLIHCEESLKRRGVESHWKAGFSNAKLADHHGATYVTKYMTKELARVRASRHYGRGFENVPF